MGGVFTMGGIRGEPTNSCERGVARVGSVDWDVHHGLYPLRVDSVHSSI